MNLDELKASGRGAITVPEFAQVLGCSRGLAYEAARDGQVIPTLRLGRRVLIPVPALLKLLGDEPEPEPDVEPDEDSLHGRGLPVAPTATMSTEPIVAPEPP